MNHLKRCKTSTFRGRLHVLNIPFQYLSVVHFLLLQIKSRGLIDLATAPFISPWPTKLLMFGEDMQSDQLHVPATSLIHFHFLTWAVANPRTTKPFSTNWFPVLHGFRNLNF